GGGAQSFNGFYLSAKDTGNANGSYLVATSQPSGTSPVSGSMSNVSGSSGTIYITGSGVETGDDGSNPVKAYTRVTADSISTVILN
ncbi:hypothetical protein GWN26_11760, partial [Candidatus Saccharibacteria bacterium]|nr:hypothetical protein [Candidatus Saccharibacteria bacterium]NIV04170.1 hypothetical protein [Calditrichia bacterium]NIV72619.1 hypothetical protein [Calditrichia bacterium]NIV99756.1 hypothetical protein [Candidatus Saccharibacteria bacterium]NIW80117.1 hypothetical protein [Calditrichia bacterium]